MFKYILATAIFSLSALSAQALEVVAAPNTDANGKIDVRISQMRTTLELFQTQLENVEACNDAGMLIEDIYLGTCKAIEVDIDQSALVGDGSETVVIVNEGSNFPSPIPCRDDHRLAWADDAWICLPGPQLPEPPECDRENSFLQWNGNTWECTPTITAETLPLPVNCTGPDQALQWSQDSGKWRCLTLDLAGMTPPVCTGENKFLQFNGTGYTCASAEFTDTTGGGNTVIVDINVGDSGGQCDIRRRSNAWSCDDSGVASCVNNSGCVCPSGFRLDQILNMNDRKKYLCIKR